MYSRPLNGALPDDMAEALRRPGALQVLDATAIARRLRGAVDPNLERMDPLDANDVIVQAVALRCRGGDVPKVMSDATFRGGPAFLSMFRPFGPSSPGLLSLSTRFPHRR